jgi:hypothetical protein
VLQDFSAGTEREITELLNWNIVPRIMQIIRTLVNCLQSCYMVEETHQIDQPTMHGMKLLNQCLFIASNLSSESIPARTEILKHNMLELIIKSFQLKLIQNSSDCLYNLSFLLRNLTQRFNSSFLKQVNTSIIVASMVHLLYMENESIEKLII